jgi:hypothetical protein
MANGSAAKADTQYHPDPDMHIDPSNDDMNSAASKPTKNCIACGSEMQLDAYLCPTCKEYQGKWRNELKYWAGIAALISLVGGGLAVCFGFLKLTRDYYLPAAMIAIDFDVFGSISLVNPSAQHALIKDFYIQSEIPGTKFQYSLRWDINKSIDPNTTFATDLVRLSKQQFKDEAKGRFGAYQGSYARSLDGTVVQQVLHHDEITLQKYLPTFLKREGAEYRQASQYFGAALSTFPCAAQLNYRLLESQSEQTIIIPCVGVIKERTSS